MTAIAESKWFLYIVRCNDSSLFTGITTDIDRRLNEHNFTKKGAKYTRARRPVNLVYCAHYNNRSSASRAECKIKKLSRSEKEKMIKIKES